MSEDNRHTRSASNRRNVLKRIGAGAVVGSGVNLVSVGSVSGSSSSSSPLNPEPDKHVPGPNVGYGFETDDGWNTHQDAAESSLNIALSANNPEKYPVDLCYVDDNQEACVKDLGETFSVGSQPCNTCSGGTTPTLNYTTATLKDLSASTSFDIWMGVNTTTGCLWAGHEDSGYAKKFDCNIQNREANRLNQPQDYETPLESAVSDVVSWVGENKYEIIATGLIVGAGVVVFGPGVASAIAFA